MTIYGIGGHEQDDDVDHKGTVTVVVPTRGLKYVDIECYWRNWSEGEYPHLDVKKDGGTSLLAKMEQWWTGTDKVSINVSGASSVTVTFWVDSSDDRHWWCLGFKSIYVHN